MQLLFLGTGCQQPTKERNHSGILFSYKDFNILFDCGEGIQRQLKIAEIKPTKITHLLITHWHGDHVLGIPGLIQTMGANEYTGKLLIFGPVGSKEYFEHMSKSFVLGNTCPYEIIEVKPGKIFENSEFELYAEEMQHAATCIAYSFVEKDKRKMLATELKKYKIPEGPLVGKLQNGDSITILGKKIKPEQVSELIKGKKLTYITDTSYNKKAIDFAIDSDVLICESTYASNLTDKADEYFHMTSKQAATIANYSNSKKLILTHFSQRYKTTSDLLEEAKEIFYDVICAYDFMKLKV